MDIVLNRLNELSLTGEPSAVIALPFQNTPKAFHRTVINAMCYTRHTLRHSSLRELVVESAVGILKASVAMEFRMCIWIGLSCLVKSLENQWIIIALTEHVGHNTPVAKVEDGA